MGKDRRAGQTPNPCEWAVSAVVAAGLTAVSFILCTCTATWTPRPGSGMDATENTGKASGPERAAEGGTAASPPVSGHPLGPDAVAILATEHWSLIGARSLLWNEAYSRTTIFLGALSAAIVALALVTNATGSGPRAVTLALVLLPVVLFLGIATHLRVVEINQAEIELMLAMNRLRNAYLRIAPALEPYFSTSSHDDERGLTASYLLTSFPGRGLRPWGRFLDRKSTRL